MRIIVTFDSDKTFLRVYMKTISVKYAFSVYLNAAFIVTVIS